MENWLNQTWIFSVIVRPMLDIALVALIVYKVYYNLVKSRALQALHGAVVLLGLYLTAYLLNLETLLWLYRVAGPFLLVMVAIVFQPELRKMFSNIGRVSWFRFESGVTGGRLGGVLSAAAALAAEKRGALIVFARGANLRSVMETGTKLDAEVTSGLLRTIFGHDTPLHDGAVIIVNGRLAAAGCFLPLSKQEDIKKSFGTRHRAALGITEETDAVTVVVSEETGALSLAYDGILHYDLTEEEANRRLRRLLKMRDQQESRDRDLTEEE